jgi:hypothetical protein
MKPCVFIKEKSFNPNWANPGERDDEMKLWKRDLQLMLVRWPFCG